MKLILIYFILLFSGLSWAKEIKKSSRPHFLPGASTPREANHNADFAPPMPGLRPSPILPITEPFAPKILSLDQFNRFASLSEGLIKGAAVKFLIDNRTKPAKINFINGNYLDSQSNRPEYVQFHYYFAQKYLNVTLDPDSFNKQTYFTNDVNAKKFIAGTLQSYQFVKDGVSTEYLGVQFYPQDAIAESTLSYALNVVREAVQIAQPSMVFVSYGQQQTYKTIASDLLRLNIKPMSVDDIYSGIPYIPMHQGTTYGYVRLFPKGAQLDNLNPSDIPVFDELPLDLSVVAGVITTVVQDAGAHVNLKSKERNTPNMVVRDDEKLALIKSFNDLPVQLKVEGESFSIVASTDEEVKKFLLKNKSNKPWIKVNSGTDTEITLFDAMAASHSILELTKKSDSYGGKASKLSLLAHKGMVGAGSALQSKYNYRLTPIGFAIPVKYYFDFLKENPSVKALVDDLVQHEMELNGATKYTSAQLIQKVATVQQAFYAGKLSPSMIQMITKKAAELKLLAAKTYPNSPIKKVKIRSSANAEDIPQFDGAGLHSSYSAKVDRIDDPSVPCTVEVSNDGVTTKEEVVPETFVCAIKGVYASLWNKRAIEERDFAHIDQRTAAMGLAVNMSYDFRKKTEKVEEIANGVLVTRIINSKGVYGYRLSINTKDNLVTNPTPGTQSEIIVASFISMEEKPSYTVVQHAKTDQGADVLKDTLLAPAYYDRMVEIARTVEINYCRNIPSYYPNGDCSWAIADPEKPSSLDMEFKIFSNGEVLIKQVREFSGR